MHNKFPQQPLPVATQLKLFSDQVHACKQWIAATARHSITFIFFCKVNGIDTTHLVKLDAHNLHSLSPETMQHLHNFFAALQFEQDAKKCMLQNQDSIDQLKTFNDSLKKNFQHGK